MTAKFESTLKTRSQAVDSALDIGRSALGIPLDQDVRVYNRLDDADFNTLIGKFGPDTVIDYIQRMEVKRLKEGSNG